MACSSLLELLRSCGGAEAISGGLTNEVLMIAFADTKPLTSSLTNEVYALSAGNMINEIGVAVGKSFVKVSLLKEVSKVESVLTKDSTGNIFHTNTFNMNLGGLTSENEVFYKSIINQPVMVIVKTQTGKYFAVGVKGNMELNTGATVSTGATGTDQQGYTLTFSETGNSPYSVDPTIILDLLEVAV